MIQIENTGEGKIRFATKDPSVIEIMLIEGKMFVHSEPLQVKVAGTPGANTTPHTATTPSFPNKTKPEEKELDFLKESKTS